ncbi:hypothetical protein FRB99_003723 [Tulasnella sp. 403]|nr:hypothetical protein FRB99_003723 [Tulasnella sp. 403]
MLSLRQTVLGSLHSPLPSLSAFQKSTYATAAKSATKGRKRPALTAGQLKDEAIKRLLYPRIIGKPRINPSGIHGRHVNRALRRVMRSAEAHETIHRAWQLHLRQLRESRDEELRVKYESMKHAMDKLKELDKELYDIATVRMDPRAFLPEDAEELKPLRGVARKFRLSRIQGLFPREMWIPTDTPRKDGWNYEWTSPLSNPPKSKA